MTRGQKLTIVLVAFSLLPIWTSGLRERMNLFEFLANHTVFGPPAEYLDEEHYLPDQAVPLEVS